MSYYYTRVRTIVDNQKDCAAELNDFYVEYSISRLCEAKNPRANSFLLYGDLVLHLKKHPYDRKRIVLHYIDKTKEFMLNFTNREDDYAEYDTNDDVLAEIKERLFYLKALHLRAIILDLIENDYTSDEPFYRPDKWIYEAMDDIEATFKGMNEMMGEFSAVFLDNCRDTFISKNRKLGYNGNLLVMNFMVYEKWAKRYFECDLGSFYECLHSNFSEGREMKTEEINSILSEYEKGKE